LLNLTELNALNVSTMPICLQCLISRRRTMLLGLELMAGMGAFAAASQFKNAETQDQKQILQRDFTVVGDTSLRDRAVRKGFLYGAAVLQSQLAKDADFAASVARECNILVPIGELKWDMLRVEPERFNFGPADALVKFAHTHKLRLRGHTLVWHQALPFWVESTMNNLNAREMMVNHISTVVRHYAGAIHSWDVVNEVVKTEDGRDDGLRDTLWLNFLGPDYIDLAFRTAAVADPSALLIYNEFGLDYDTTAGDAKRAAVLNLLTRLKRKGTPIHGLGIQAHLGRESKAKLQPVQLKQFLRAVADLGLKILITELDVTEQALPKDIRLRDHSIAALYEDYLAIALEEPAVIAVLTWGLSDRYTWLSTAEPRPDGSPVRPLPLDAQMNRKLVWNAIARSLDKTTQRSMLP
jgi:endo-1,4-beta-xylanase